MNVLFVADGRSPITQNWIHYFIQQGHEVHLVSLFPCELDITLHSLHILPVAFSRVVPPRRSTTTPQTFPKNLLAGIVRRIASPRVRTALRHWFVPLSLPRAAYHLTAILNSIQPDLIHAMRIPYEGMLAALADPSPPLLISVWGNDFTLHASSTSRMSQLTRLAMGRVDALHTDCERDLRLARAWGFPTNRSAIVIPTGGGVKMDLFYPRSSQPGESSEDHQPWTIINPRGMRAYVCNEAFFQAIPRVLARYPQTQFVCPAMAGAPEPKRWVSELNITSAVQLLPMQDPAQMANLFRQSQVMVSPTTHDGTPNSLLEAMASGCLPVAGDLDSLREWITPGVNGILMDPTNPQAIAAAILDALEQPDFRARAAEHNADLITKRAEYPRVMARAAKFYQELVAKKTGDR